MNEGPQRVLLFDIDGTLLRLTQPERSAYARSLQDTLDVTVDDWSRYRSTNHLRLTEEIIAERLGRAPGPGEAERVAQAYFSNLHQGIARGSIQPQIMPGALEGMLAAWGTGAFTMGLATGNYRTAAEARLKAVGLGQCFAFGGFAEDGEDKAAILARALDCCPALASGRLQRKNVIYFGDLPEDVAAAERNAVAFIGIAASRPQRHALEAAGATRTISSLSWPFATGDD